MRACAIDPSETSQLVDVTSVRYAVVLLAFSFAVVIAWYVVSRLNIGLDVSDSAYYIISYAMHRDIESQSTLAGWLWASMFPFDGILTNRYLAVVFLVVCFSILALQACRTTSGGQSGQIVAFAFACAGSLVYYVHWLPDPSYNSINLGYIALAWAGTLGLLHSTSNSATIRSSAAIWALIVGCMVASDFLVKPTSAVLLGLALLVFYLALTRRDHNWRRILFLILAALLGALLPFVVLSTIGETPERVFTTLKNGAEAGFTIATPSLSPLRPLLTYLGSVFSAPVFRQWFTWIAIVIVAITSSASLSSRFRLVPIMRVSFSVVTAIGFPLLVWRAGLFAWSDRGINGFLILILALAARGVLLASPQHRRPLWIILGAMTISPVIYVFGTGNAWEYLIPTASGFACVALGIVIANLPGLQQSLIAIPGLGLLAVLLVGTAIGIEWYPYRTSAPLSSLQSSARVGPRNEQFLESPQQATFYNKLANIRPMVERLSERPYLIDLSGRVPMVAFQVGAKVPRTPWLLSGYSGSTELFHLILGKISRKELQRAWIFQSRAYNGHFPDDIVQSYGLDFPTGYVPLATVPIQYLGVEGTLYAPIAAVRNIDLLKLQH